ncbi:2Fe-2S iron-sulfur cluster-binding protein [Paraburkholderia caffeinilytica]|uniref:2Fe-2S iron-sulfur cluster-binding protein n=1 Tax=Paraburkholderia caffeinilytica TaxID=1761016 RepID=UPI003DA0D89D
MPKITFVGADGTCTSIEESVGVSLMQAAINHGVPGIAGECGGACSCATCHIFVDEPWASRLAPLGDMEDAMLEATVEPRSPASRLGCQIEIANEIDGLKVRLPNRQT